MNFSGDELDLRGLLFFSGVVSRLFCFFSAVGTGEFSEIRVRLIGFTCSTFDCSGFLLIGSGDELSRRSLVFDDALTFLPAEISGELLESTRLDLFSPDN